MRINGKQADETIRYSNPTDGLEAIITQIETGRFAGQWRVQMRDTDANETVAIKYAHRHDWACAEALSFVTGVRV